MPSKSEMLRDPRNIELLRLLADDPRLGVAELARRVGLSAPATRERLARLEEAKVIAGYRLLIDPAALGYPIAALVRIRPSPGQLKKVIELAQATPQVVECYRVTGEDCFVLKVYLPALDELDGLLDRFLVFGQTTTSLIQSTPVPLRDLPLPNGDEAAGGRKPHRRLRGRALSRGVSALSRGVSSSQ